MAITLVGVGTNVQVTATTHTLVEPAGVLPGDLLVACIGSRIASFTQITLPSGWVRANQALTNNVAADTTGLGSAMMAYIIRGASAPSFTFTHPVAPSVAVGRVIAYRGIDVVAPHIGTEDSGQQTAANTTACSWTGLTTSQDNDLIVAMCVGGRAATYANFNATNPGTSAGTVDNTTTPPTAGTWYRRAGITTTTGADTALAIFDAIRASAGATGNFTTTASVAGGHALITSAFKLSPPVFRSQASALYASRTGSTTVAAPAGIVDGDILVAAFAMGRASSGISGDDPTLPAGWAEFGTVQEANDGSFFLRFHTYWKRASSESGSYVFTHAATMSTECVIAAYSGCTGSGVPFSANSVNSGGGQNASGTGITTTAADSLLLYLAHDWTGSGALTPPTGMTERFDSLAYVADEVIATPSATGTRAQTNGNTSAFGEKWAVRMLELRLSAASGTTYNETVAETAAAAETLALLTESKVRETETADWRETEAGAIRITEGAFFVTPPIEASVAESASAADTVTGARTYTCAIAENAGANETITITLLRIGAIAESAAAADTTTGLLVRIGAVAETASAAETTDASIVPAAGIFDKMVVETAPVVDTTDTSVIFTRAIVETASAAETIGKTLSLTSAVSETAAAADTVGGLAVRAGAIAESATAVETVAGLLTRTVAVVETAAAAETITYSLTGAAGTTYNEAVLEAAVAADTLTGRLTALGAVAEAAVAFETITRAVSYTKAIVETATAADTVTGLRVIVGAIAETAVAAETTTAGLLGISGAIAETAAAAETIDATVIALPQIYDVTVAESANAADTLTVIIRRWTKEPPPWADWVEEVTAAVDWSASAPEARSWNVDTLYAPRATETHGVRYTQQGQRRIVYRQPATSWTKTAPPSSRWSRVPA